jgi:hypothetical protein
MDHVFRLGPMGDNSLRQVAESFCKDKDMVENLVHMANGNIGAMTAMGKMYNYDESRASFALGLAAAFEIKGSMLWLLFKDVCGQDPTKVIEILNKEDEAPKALAALHYSGFKWPK